MKPQTIDQYKIMVWLEEQFHISAITVVFLTSNTAQITDCDGETAIVTCIDGEIKLE